MKSLLLRFWRWLGRLLGQDSNIETHNTTAMPDAPAATAARPAVPPAPQVTLPPPLPPQMDIHAGETAQFGRKASILTRNEQKLYRTLLLALHSEYQVMAKVRLWDILWLINEPPERKQHLSRLSCRHVDFLLCEPLTLKPLLAIELDDASHRTTYAEENDRYKNELFQAAGLPLLRLPHSDVPAQQLKQRITSAIEGH